MLTRGNAVVSGNLVAICRYYKRWLTEKNYTNKATALFIKVMNCLESTIGHQVMFG